MTIKDFCNTIGTNETIFITYKADPKHTNDISKQQIIAAYNRQYFNDVFYNNNLFELTIENIYNAKYGTILEVKRP